MGYLIIFGVVVIVIVALGIAVMQRANAAARLADEMDEDFGEYDRPRATQLRFFLFAWASPLVAMVGMLALYSILNQPYNANAPRLSGAQRQANMSWLFTFPMLGVGLAVAGLCGIRAGRRSLLTLAGSLLGLVLNLLLGLATLLMSMIKGFEGPYV